MIPAAFEYRAPRTVEEALALLAKHREEARVLTGGHGLIPALKLRQETPALVVDLRRIPGLGDVEPLDPAPPSPRAAPPDPPCGGPGRSGGLRIGALVSHRALAEAPTVRSRCPVLAEVAALIGDPQVRSVGTLVGSICHGDPAADYPAVLLALGARVLIASPRGERLAEVAEFIQGPFETALEPDELVLAVEVDRSAPASSAYYKVHRSASGFALAAAAAVVEIEGERIRSCAIGVTGVATRPFRAHAVEERLVGALCAHGFPEGAARGASDGQSVLDDLHASAEYRAHLAEVCIRRAVEKALSRR